MTIHILKSKRVMIFSSAILVIASVAGVTATKLREKGATQETRQAIEKLPEKLPTIISQVRKLEVISARLEKTGAAESAAVVLEIRNHSDAAVIALTLESGDDNDVSGIHTHGDLDAEAPPIIIKPQQTAIFRFPLTEMIPNTPLRVAGAFYADGTEDGKESTLRTMRSQRAHDRAEREQRQGGRPQ
jgi:hypothetical protein